MARNGKHIQSDKEARPVSKEGVFQLIGQLSVCFATLDLLLANACHILVPPESPLRRNFRPGMTIGQRVETLQGLDPQSTVSPDAFREFQDHLPEMLTLVNLRNRFLHDQWLLSEDALKNGMMIVHRLELSKTGELLNSVTSQTVESFIDVVRRVEAAQNIAGLFLERICNCDIKVTGMQKRS